MKGDEISIRIKDLVANYLLEIATDNSGWCKLYMDPQDNRYWDCHILTVIYREGAHVY